MASTMAPLRRKEPHDATKGVLEVAFREGGWPHEPVPWARSRQVPALYLSRGERILHIGCGDNLGLDRTLAAGGHLHAILEATEPDILGVDVDAAAVAQLREHGLRHVEAVDITSGRGRALARRFNPSVLLLPEVLEHLDNPGSFLAALAEVAGETGARLVLSTPNAFGAVAMQRSTDRFERVNPDHRFYFSRATLERLLNASGWRATQWLAYAYGPLPRQVLRYDPPGYRAFEQDVLRQYPGLLPESWRGGRPWVPTWAKRLHHRLLHEPRYRLPVQYDGLVVQAVVRDG